MILYAYIGIFVNIPVLDEQDEIKWDALLEHSLNSLKHRSLSLKARTQLKRV